MQRVILSRTIMSEYGTFGTWELDRHPICVSVELPWKDNQHYVSCIPAGLYLCEKMVHIKHGLIWRLPNVPGRQGVLIHPGNTIKDLLGCIAPGRSFGMVNGLPGVQNSELALESLRAQLGDKFELEIRDVFQ